jgi:hypothetical protein
MYLCILLCMYVCMYVYKNEPGSPPFSKTRETNFAAAAGTFNCKNGLGLLGPYKDALPSPLPLNVLFIALLPAVLDNLLQRLVHC